MLRRGARGSKASGGRWVSVLVGLVVAAGLVVAPQAVATEGVLDAGGSHSCAVKTNGTPVCWGSDSHQQVSGIPSDIGTVSSISAGGGHSCAVKTGGTPI